MSDKQQASKQTVFDKPTDRDNQDDLYEYKKEPIKLPDCPTANAAKLNKINKLKIIKNQVQNQLKPVFIKLRNMPAIDPRLLELDEPIDFDSQNKDHMTIMEALVNIPITWYKYPFRYSGNIDVNRLLADSDVLNTCVKRMQKEMMPVFSNTTDYEKFRYNYVPYYSVNQVKTFLTPYVNALKVSRETLKKFEIDKYSSESLDWSTLVLTDEHKKLYKTEYILELIPDRRIKNMTDPSNQTGTAYQNDRPIFGLQISSWGYNNKYYDKELKWTCSQTLCIMMGWFLPDDKFIGYFDFSDGVNQYIGIGYFIYTRAWVKVPVVVNMFVYNGIHIEGKQDDGSDKYRNIKSILEEQNDKHDQKEIDQKEEPPLVNYVIPYHVNGWVDEQFRPHNEDCPDQITYVTDEHRALSGIFSHGLFKPQIYTKDELLSVYCE